MYLGGFSGVYVCSFTIIGEEIKGSPAFFIPIKSSFYQYGYLMDVQVSFRYYHITGSSG